MLDNLCNELALSTAAHIQANYERELLERHKDRVKWLSQEKPTWADGVPVDAHTRHALLVQSQNYIAAHDAS